MTPHSRSVCLGGVAVDAATAAAVSADAAVDAGGVADPRTALITAKTSSIKREWPGLQRQKEKTNTTGTN